MSGSVVLFLVSILIIAAMLMTVILLTRRKGAALNVQRYQSRWLAIESSLRRDNHASYHLAVLNADKLVDQALRESGYSGSTMGERMKSADGAWSNSNHIWSAHKLRNKIAHEPDVEVGYELAARSLAAFKQALKDLGAV